MSQKLKLDRSMKIYEEAQDYIPGAVAGIRRPYNFVPGEYPIYFDRAEGGKVFDVDGNSYIDYLCAYGPIIIGHKEKEIDDAVIAQIQNKGFCMSLTQEVQVTLAKKLRTLIPSCEKMAFVKTGSDATTVAIRVSRAHTGKKKVLRCGYHGWHDWCVEMKGGVLPKAYEDVYEFHYNDLEGFEALMKEHGNDVAAVIVTPVGHPLAHAVEMPKPGFLEGVKATAEKFGAVLVFDEIRSGFRVNLGGAQKEFGVTPHLSVFGKAIANGYPLSVVVGKKEIMDVLIDKAFLSSTFFPNALEYVAALKTIELLERDKMLDVIKVKGNYFSSEIAKLISQKGIPAEVSGGPWMPFITFHQDEKKLYKTIRPKFYTELIRRGVFLQPYHHGYIAYRHTEAELEYSVKMIGESFDEIKKDC